MGVHVALLSAVNLGGRKVAMAPLRAACLAAGFQRVETLLASGNVLLDGGRKGPAAIAQTLQALIAEHFNVATTAILRDAAALAQALADCPYPDCPPDRQMLIFLQRTPAKAEAAALAAFVAGRDTYSLIGDVIHLRADRGGNDIRITPAAMRRHLGQVGTARNVNTVTKLVAKARDMEAA
jgi:uncharacterized protein (DUF1697 family)